MLRLVVSLGLILTFAPSAFAWGPGAHRLADRWAIETLPPEVRGFFEANRQFIVDHANDPDAWMEKDAFERKRHYIYLDKYGMFPYLNLPHSYKAATEQYFKLSVNRDGLLPWTVGEYSLRLTNAFREQNWEQVKLQAAALGHYVADADDPLHTTQNYDGQLTKQTGLSDRFDIRLIDRFSNFFIMSPQNASKIDDPTEYAFQMVLESNTWVEPHHLGRRAGPGGLAILQRRLLGSLLRAGRLDRDEEDQRRRARYRLLLVHRVGERRPARFAGKMNCRLLIDDCPLKTMPNGGTFPQSAIENRQSAMATSSIESFINRLPKVELHLHLEGSARPETLRELARAKSRLDRETEDWIGQRERTNFRYENSRDFLAAFKLVTLLLESPQDYALVLTRLAEDLAAQNVKYAEVTLSAGVILWKQQAVDAVFEALAAAASEAQARLGVRVRWIFDAIRHFGAEHARQVLDWATRFRSQGVVAFGIGGDEIRGPAELFAEVYRAARDSGLHVTAHAGESAGPESIRAAVELLGAERIGHG